MINCLTIEGLYIKVATAVIAFTILLQTVMPAGMQVANAGTGAEGTHLFLLFFFVFVLLLLILLLFLLLVLRRWRWRRRRRGLFLVRLLRSKGEAQVASGCFGALQQAACL